MRLLISQVLLFISKVRLKYNQPTAEMKGAALDYNPSYVLYKFSSRLCLSVSVSVCGRERGSGAEAMTQRCFCTISHDAPQGVKQADAFQTALRHSEVSLI